MNTIRVFCEGEDKSIDNAVYQALLRGKLNGVNPIITPIGGKRGMSSFAKGLMKGSTVTSKWVAIRDRDLDQHADDGSLSLFQDEKQVYVTGLTSVDGYLLDTQLFWRCTQEKSKIHKPSLEALNASLNEILQILHKYQAIRWALQDIRQEIIDKAKAENLIRRNFDLTNKIDEVEDNNSFNESEDDLIEFAERKILALHRVLQHLGQPEIAQIHRRYEEYRDKFQKFTVENEEYKYWFHCKQVMELWRRHRTISICGIRYEAYYTNYARYIDFDKYIDLIEFRKKCEELGNS